MNGPTAAEDPAGRFVAASGLSREDLQRRCIWPECRSSYDVSAGPLSEGWKRVLGLFGVLCPMHADLGHLPDAGSVPQVPPFRARGHLLHCECGARGPAGRLSLHSVVEDWRVHLAELPEPERPLS